MCVLSLLAQLYVNGYLSREDTVPAPPLRATPPNPCFACTGYEPIGRAQENAIAPNAQTPVLHGLKSKIGCFGRAMPFGDFDGFISSFGAVPYGCFANVRIFARPVVCR